MARHHLRGSLPARNPPPRTSQLQRIHRRTQAIDRLFRPKYVKQTLVAVAIPFFQQFSGINAFVYYAPTFFAALGQSYEMTLILSGMVNICQLVAGIPTFLYLDKMGRASRPSSAVSSWACLTSSWPASWVSSVAAGRHIQGWAGLALL
jgi:hypothetical protein